MEAQRSGMAALAAGLTKRLADTNSNSNLVCSPLSIYALLALLAAGAGGHTLEEILRVLGVRSRRELEDSVARLLDGPLKDTSESGGPRVAFTYGVWSDLTRPMKQAYQEAVVGTYKAQASIVDFLNDSEQAGGQINAWAAEATRNLITSVVPPGRLDSETKLVLANAVYFRGKWDLPFYEIRTKNGPFYRLDGTAVNVPFMTNSYSHYIAEHDGFKMLKLRYKSSPHARFHHCMCILLPDALDGLGSLLDKVTSSPSFLRDHLPNYPVKVDQFRVPKFELSFESSVTTILKNLGLRLPFSLEADLSEMLEDDGSNLPLVVQNVFHKAVIEVNEEGTRAAAVTYEYSPSSPGYSPDPSPSVDFVANHPFAYFIIEEGSDAVLFAGHVVDPSNGAGVVIPSPVPFQEYTTTERNFDDATDTSPPVYSPVSPEYYPSPVYQHTQYQYHPSRPTYRPTSPAYYLPAYRPTSPVYRPTVRPTVPAYINLLDMVGPDRPQEVDGMRCGSQPKEIAPQTAATGEDELPGEKRE